MKLAAIAMAVSSGRLAAADRGYVFDLLDLAQTDETQTIYAAMDSKVRRRGKGFGD